MLLLRTERLPEDPDWLYELKLDSYRAITGQFADDVELDTFAYVPHRETEFSPGVHRMQAMVGQESPFDHGRQQMKLLADLEVTTKAVERTAEAIRSCGTRARSASAAENIPRPHYPDVTDLERFHAELRGVRLCACLTSPTIPTICISIFRRPRRRCFPMGSPREARLSAVPGSIHGINGGVTPN